MNEIFPMMWRFTDIDNPVIFACLVAIRICQALFWAKTMAHPDEYWQSTEIAYKTVY
jgi:hypothetical protein